MVTSGQIHAPAVLAPGNNVRWVADTDWMAEHECTFALSSPFAWVYSDSFISLSLSLHVPNREQLKVCS